MATPFIFQLQNATYNSLLAGQFQLAVIDPDDTGITAAQVNTLEQTQNKMMISYLSIGEAEDYRAYWTPAWNINPPSFILSENPSWPGNFSVKFWDPTWQQIMFNRVDQLVAMGFRHVVNLGGGMLGVNAAGMPTDR